MNEYVEIRFIDEVKGKGIFCKTDIKKGFTILEEEPVVSSQFAWNALYKYKACHHCLKPLETSEENARRLSGNHDLVLPYPECCVTKKEDIISCDRCGIEYCCSECRDNAELQYHKTLCFKKNGSHPLEILEEAWRNLHYPPETSSIMLIVRLLARIIQSPDPQIAVSQTMQFCHRTVNEEAELSHKLLGEKFFEHRATLLELIRNALHHDVISMFLTEEGFTSLLALIGTNGQGVGTSSISQWVARTSELKLSTDERDELEKFIDKLYGDMEAHSGTFLNNEGVALYHLQSTANHSCSPNAQVEFLHNNFKLSLTALRDIKEGEEIFISYLDECSLERSRHSRRRELTENYLFACNCEKCLEQIDEPDVTSEEEDDDESMSE